MLVVDIFSKADDYLLATTTGTTTIATITTIPESAAITMVTAMPLLFGYVHFRLTLIVCMCACDVRTPTSFLCTSNRLEQALAVTWIRSHLEDDHQICVPKHEVYDEYR